MAKLILFLLIGTVLRASPSDPPIGLIDSIAGPVKICSALCDSSPTRWRDLDNAKDIALILRGGEKFQCNGGKVVVYTPEKLYDVCANKAREPTVKKVMFDSNVTPRRKLFLQDYYSAAYRLAGRPKGTASLVLVPPDDGAIDPAGLIVRWRNRPPLKTLSITISTSQSLELVRVDDVDGSTGSLDSDLIRNALEKVRDNASLNHELHLTIRAKMRSDDVVQFSVLTHAEASELAKSLAEVATGSGVIGFIQRAGVYESARMYDRVAEQYDSALKVAPESRDLMQAGYNANLRFGDLRRANELMDQLERIGAPPEPN